MNSDGQLRGSWIQLEARLRAHLCAFLGVDPSVVTMGATLVDLDADSLDRVEIALMVGEELGIAIPNEWFERFGLDTNLGVLFESLVRDYGAILASGIDRQALVFHVRDDGTIAVGVRHADGAWTYADGGSRLPSGLYVVSVASWASVLAELEDIINSPDSHEAELQGFFERHPALLQGDEYDRIIPQATIVGSASESGRAWRADFVLAPVDQSAFCKVLELKLPKAGTMRPTSSAHASFYATLYAAIHQLRDYGEAFNDLQTRQRFANAYDLEVYRPDLQLIVGRKWEVEMIPRMLELQRRHDLRIDDWDTYLTRLRRRFA